MEGETGWIGRLRREWTFHVNVAISCCIMQNAHARARLAMPEAAVNRIPRPDDTSHPYVS